MVSLLQWELGAAGALACAVPAVRRRLNRRFDRLREPSPSAARRAAVGLAIASSFYFCFAGYFQAWDFILRFQDEHSYALQLRMLARGRLWMPALSPQIADFFGSLNIFTSPTYGSMYSPGTALLFVPSIWLHLPFWVMPAAAAGACVGLLYLILLELTDGVYALLGAVMLASLPVYRAASLMLLSQMPVLLFGLAMMLAWLRWRKKRTALRCVLIGVFAGWAAITRPLDALCFALPIGCAVLFDLGSIRACTKATLCLLLGAAPFLALQAVQNKGMTGRWRQFPIDLFHAQTYPAPLLGFYQVDWAHVPVPALAQNHEMVETSAWPLFRDHTIGNIPRELWIERLPRTLLMTLPWRWLVFLLPIGLLGLGNRRRRRASTGFDPRRLVFALVPALFLILYIPYIFYQPHYLVVAAPGVILVVLLGLQKLRNPWPTARSWLEPLLVMATLGVTIGSFTLMDETTWASWQDLSRIEARLAQLPNQPALVLFRYHPLHPEWNICFHEPVYNTQTAWPDDATIIRAHDLGWENIRLFRYYAQRQPQRMVYLYDRADDSIKPLGTAAELAATYNSANRSSNHGG